MLEPANAVLPPGEKGGGGGADTDISETVSYLDELLRASNNGIVINLNGRFYKEIQNTNFTWKSFTEDLI